MPRPRSSTSNLVRLLNRSSGPIYALNEKRKVIFCNEACATWLKLDVDDIVGKVLEYHSRELDESILEILSGLCPPPEVFSGIESQSIVVAKYPDAIWSRRKARFLPLEEDGGFVGIIAYVDGKDLPSGTTSLEGPTSESQQLHDLIIEHRKSLARRFPMTTLAGKSDSIKHIRQKVSLALKQPTNVVITGPIGIGKQHLARTIHYNHTPSFSGALTPIACEIITDEMLTSIITDFIQECSRTQSFDSSTLLLLNIDKLQTPEARILNTLLLEAPQPILTISTSSIGLSELVESKNFPEALAARLSTLPIHIPSLADRPEDIPALAQLILESKNIGRDEQVSGFTPEAMDILIDHPWHGNCSELEEIIEASIVNCTNHEVTAADLPDAIRLARDADRHQRIPTVTPQLDQTLEDVEYLLISETLSATDGNKAEAARRLGISRARLIRRWQALQNRNHENNGQA